MAPSRRSKDTDVDAPPLWLEEILKRWDSYLQKFDRIFDFMLKIQESQTSILNRLKNLESNITSSTGDHNTEALYSTLVKFHCDAKTVQEKSCRITWVGVGEHENSQSTHAFDCEAVKEVIEASGDDELLSEWRNRKIDVRRFPEGQVRSNDQRPRIIKIALRSKDLRDKLLDHMRRGRLSLTSQFVHSYARKDYTREELEFDRALRRKAGEMNKQEGKLSYVVRDLSIHKLKTPRDLTARSGNSSVSRPRDSSNNSCLPLQSSSNSDSVDLNPTPHFVLPQRQATYSSQQLGYSFNNNSIDSSASR